MSDDRRVARRSDRECREIAWVTKEYCGFKRRWPVYPAAVLRSGKILTLRGEKKLVYEVVDDHLLGGDDGETTFSNGTIKVTVKRSVDSQAGWGADRPRMTLAHELAHGVMHACEGVVDHRATGATGMTTISKLNASESAEHQAKVFASAFLIDDTEAARLKSAEEISAEFLVSREAAEICFKRLQEEAERAAASLRVRQSNEEFQRLMRQIGKPQRHLDIPCISCKRTTLIPLGQKVFCETCHYKGDHPQSGDPAA
jgi:predicted SprT family Zn-dependent metalloprotease